MINMGTNARRLRLVPYWRIVVGNGVLGCVPMPINDEWLEEMKMKLKWLLLGLLAIGSSAMASTIALWDFDDIFAANGVSLPYTTNDAFVVSATDKSGNGNDLSLWTDGSAGKEIWSNTNSYFGDWSILGVGVGSWDWEDLRTVSNTVPSGVDIRTITPVTLTVESVFTVESHQWDVLVCRAGNVADAPSFRLLLNDQGRPQVLWRDVSGVQTEVTGPDAVEINADQWHHLAATADDSNLLLYLDGQLIASNTMSNAGLELDSGTGTGADQAHTWNGGDWSVCRGMWQGSKSDGYSGKIDAVAISDETLVPAGFVLQFPVAEGPVVPADGDSTTNRIVSATMYPFGLTIDTLDLYVDGASVATTNVAPGAASAIVTYDGSSIAAGTHTGMVVTTTTDLQYFTNVWSFTFIDTVPEPALYASELYNINYAGRTGSNMTVPDGTVVKAPALTSSDRWNNLVAPTVNGWESWTPASPLTINNAYGTNTISLTWSGTAHDWSNGGFGYAGLFNGYLGSGGFDGNMVISGLDTNATYDIYCYFTWGWTTSMSTFTVTEGMAPLPSATVTPVQANAGSYSNLVEGQNYAVFADVVPSSNGVIQVRSQNSDGGWSGMQIVKRSDVPVSFFVPYAEGEMIPAEGSRFTNDVVDISGTMYNVDAGVDSMELYLNGDLVASESSLYGLSDTNTVSYGATALSNGLQTVMMITSGYGLTDGLTYSHTNEWSFYWFDHFATPAAAALELYNVNMAGFEGSGSVADGIVLVAPTTGGIGTWYNYFSTGNKWVVPGLVQLSAANESNTNTVGFEVGVSTWDDGPASWAGYYDEFTALSNTIWGATIGDNDNGWTRFTGLDTNAAYDVYIYWTWNRGDDTKTFSLTAGTANMPDATIALDRAALVANPTNYVLGTNYAVIAEVTPDASGMIEFGSSYSSAYQLVRRADGPGVSPDIQTMVISGGMASLRWDSEYGISYRIMHKTSLKASTWTEVTNGITGVGTTTSVSVPASSSQEFFKIEGH